MNKLESKATLDEKYAFAGVFGKKRAFIPFITCGYPNIQTSKQIIYALAEQGADIIELGIPFSDPVAEGKTIQKANALALQQGVHCEVVFDLVEKVRVKSKVKLAFMTYANIVFAYGIDKFVEKMASLGVGGLILADVPYEERDIFATSFACVALDMPNPTATGTLECLRISSMIDSNPLSISLLTPVTPSELTQ